MNLQKFTFYVLSILFGFLMIAFLLQDTYYVNFFLVDKNNYSKVYTEDRILIPSCSEYYLDKQRIISFQEPSFEFVIQKILSIKTPNYGGLYSPFYESDLRFEISEDQEGLKILDLKGDLNILSECETPVVDRLLKENLDLYYPDYRHEIRLNGSVEEYQSVIDI